MSGTDSETDTAAAPHAGFVTRPVDRWRHGQAVHEDDCVAEEVPLALVYNGASFAVMMATPRDLEDFALGFSLSEGLIDTPAQLLQLQVRTLIEGVELAMRVADDAPAARPDRTRERLMPGRSGCGICGTRDLEQAVRQPDPVGAGSAFAPEALELALAQLQTRQPMNAATGAVHAAAWADRSGRIVLVREDVGRHNALDKLIGAMRHRGIDPNDGMLLVTSRASYEMVTKAASAGVTLLAAISAPTALAIELARGAGVTLIGFARPGSHNVYTHPHRLLPATRQELT
ncbi:MAG: formate dehydrogenase accessory sulfurtransferase FdhD [Xanthomonadaceae bacterium]|jgi:FdhD protein|nr:formate dehydrogenase accessory sulfurtransferase FdhD [Xanthomonadaceae bacterium]MDE3072266.1 formate dehydrogenase accessory sulfurtransferase FdhD [Pseudomonadota bacterium]